ncbi:Nitroreductase-like protein [Penicillium alfredii]|uniref:Nitroreductase-like protein n=1 Tax=Penicillium alfredii TaxID=1506179 RepID=A0A9W9KQ39_9EURO|nr:Nitroreductase-like protein [Penicillium alfredii]KAJ5115079.1 Nitroreductase-like protein [Penicillium alfredii]
MHHLASAICEGFQGRRSIYSLTNERNAAIRRLDIAAICSTIVPCSMDLLAKQWDIPAEWSLKAQLVFGKPTGPPREKTFEPIVDLVGKFPAIRTPAVLGPRANTFKSSVAPSMVLVSRL